MSQARKCDRCGKLYEYYCGNDKFKYSERANGVVFVNKDLEDNKWYRNPYDLCIECMEELEAFIFSNKGD